MPKNLIRPDGSTIRVEDGDAEKLQTLGYKEENPVDEAHRAIEAGQESYYSSTGQRVLTGIEGGLSGLTLGASDLLINGEGTQERAKYNPGTRLATELIGGLAPSLPGLSVLKELTPAGRLISGAEKAGEAVGRGSATFKALTQGVVEGAGFGGNQAVTEAELNGDPLTVESVMAGMGWGAIYGGGLSALGAKAADVFESRAARAAAEEAAGHGPTRAEILAGAESERALGEAQVHSVLTEGMKGEHAAVGAIEEGHYANFQGAVQDATEQLNQAKKTVAEMDVERAVAEAQGQLTKPKVELRPLKNDFSSFESSLIDSGDIKLFRQEMRNANKTLGKIMGSAERGEFEALQGHLETFSDQLTGISDSMGGNPKIQKMVRGVEKAADALAAHSTNLEQVASPIREAAAAQAKRAAEDLAQISAVHAELSGFPKTPEEFARMNPKRVEKLSAALDSFNGIKSAELSGVQEALKTSMDNLKMGLGITVEGTPGQQLREIQKLLKEAGSRRTVDALKMTEQGRVLWEKAGKTEERASRARVMGDTERASESGAKRGRFMPWMVRHGVGVWAAEKVGGGLPGAAAYTIGAGLASKFVGMKGAIMRTLSEKANKWVPRAGRALQKVGPRVEPLMTRLDGTIEDRRASRQELMRARAKEVADAAPIVRDTLYRSVQPLAITNPALAAGLHAHGVERFQFLLSKLPKDPGLAYSNLKSLWKPDPVAVEKFARFYEVFQNPVAVVSRALDTGKVTLEAAEGLREMNPELFSYLRSMMVERLADPDVLKRMTYADQVHLGTLLDLPLHSSMDPRFIVNQQQMYQERNKPLEMNPRIQPGGGAGRPSGPGPSATSAQRTTEH